MITFDVESFTDHAEKTVEKDWGVEYWLENNPDYCLKLIELYQGKECSFHFHKNKKETFIMLQGIMELYIHHFGMKYLYPGNKVTLDKNTVHRFRGIAEDNFFLEVSTFHEDSDSYRIKPEDL